MKKIVASLMAFVMVVMSTLTVFGATKQDVQQKMDSSIKYAFDGNYGSDGYDFSNSKNFNIYLRAGGKADAYKDDYVASVKDAVLGGSAYAGNIALAMQNFILMGVDDSTLNDAFLASPASAYSGYYMTYAAQTASILGEDELAKQICQQNADTYTMGVGTDFWGGYGTSADDLAMFILCLVNAGDEFQVYIDDAVTLLESYYTPEGYDNWGANADSTALALAVYSALEDDEKADKVYDMLIDNFYDGETGGFKADFDPYYATSDAVYGMSFYLDIAVDPEEPTTESTTEPVTQEETTTQNQNAPTQELTTQAQTTEATTKDNSKKSPQTGDENLAFIIVGVTVLFGTMFVVSKKRKADNK